METITIDIPINETGYEKFIQCKRLPRYSVRGNQVFTDEQSYAHVFGTSESSSLKTKAKWLFDFQRDTANRGLSLKRFCAFLSCGLGKTPLELAWAKTVSQLGKVMIQCPLAVYHQYLKEAVKFLGHPIQDLRRGEEWRDIGIMNFESMRNFDMTGCAGFVLDESSILKNATGETKDYLCDIVKNVEYRLAGSATPAPNYHEEYATQAVFLGLYKSENEFYAKYFRKDGNKWILRGHAREAFYRDLASWATYLQKPSLLGYEHTTELPEEPEYIWQYCDTDSGQRIPSGKLIASSENFKDLNFIYGAVRSQVGSPRTQAIVNYAKGKRCIIWVHRDAEEDTIAKAIGDCCVINGSMPIERRVESVEAYRAGRIRHIVSKPTVLGFGVNIPECDDMIYSGFTYSMEQFYQAVRRAHRYGRKGRLRVFVPYTDAEMPILNDLQGKLERFQTDAEELQSRFFGAHR